MFDCLKFRRKPLSPTPNAIERFTYDWLTRFMELTPHNASPKITLISPLFNQCATKYAPHFVRFSATNPARTYKPPNTKNKIICTGQNYFVHSVGSIENTTAVSAQIAKFMDQRFYFYLTEIMIINIKNVEFAALQRLLTKSVKKLSVYCSKLTTQIYFSQLWPLISHCEHINLDLKNLYYDEDMTDLMMDNGPCERLSYLQLAKIPGLECIVYPIVDHILATSKRNHMTISLTGPTLASNVNETITQKIKMAGFSFSRSFHMMFEIQKTDFPFDHAFTYLAGMSIPTPSKTAIQQFTYDWLLRFTELTPQENISRIQSISPFYKRNVDKYAPEFRSTNGLSYNYYKDVPTVVKKDLVYTSSLTLHRIEELAKFLHPRIYLNLTVVYLDGIFKECWEFSNVKKLLSKSVKKVFFLANCEFTEPILFSELWPMISHCESISINIKNIKFDFVFDRKKPSQKLAKLDIFNVPASMEAVYPIVEQFLTTKCEQSTIILYFQRGSSQKEIETMTELVYHKIRLAGFTISGYNAFAGKTEQIRASYQFEVVDDEFTPYFVYGRLLNPSGSRIRLAESMTLNPYVLGRYVMSIPTPSKAAIQSFTYDWLLRFTELTPEKNMSRISAISPFYKHSVNKYAPEFRNTYGLSMNYYKADRPLSLPTVFKKDIVYTGSLKLHRTDDLNKFLHRRIHLNLTDVYVDGYFNQCWVFSNVKKLLTKSVGHILFLANCAFTEEVLFSELWPLISHCEIISISIENIKFDFMFDKSKPCQKLAGLTIFNLPASIEVVHPIVEQFLTTKCKHSKISLYFQKGSSQKEIETMAKFVYNKILG